MLIPSNYSYPTESELILIRRAKAVKTAKDLAQRIKLFEQDLQKSKLKKSDIDSIKAIITEKIKHW